jgi:branched-chain amino acid transport system substrate-binding protein
MLTTGFYWDMDDETRAWSRRYFDQVGAMPTMFQAGLYSAIRHYLKAVAAAGTTEGFAVAETMRALPVEDFFAKHGRIRPDGRMAYPMYLAQVKSPAESKYPWDYYKILETIPIADAYRPLSQSDCPLVRHEGSDEAPPHQGAGQRPR